MAEVLGLDIGPRAVRAALLRVSLRRTTVLRYLEVPLSFPVSEEALRQAVRQLVAALGKPPDTVVAELDGREGASLRTVSLPLAAARRVTEVLPFELEGQVPFDIEEAIVDYQEAGRDTSQIHLLATVAPKEAVAERLQTLRTAGVDPKQLAVGAAALDGLTALLPGLTEGGPHLIVDVEEDLTDLCLLHEGRCIAARTLSHGTHSLREGRGKALERELRQTLAGHRAAGGLPPVSVHLAGDLAPDPDALPWLRHLCGAEAAVLELPEAPGGGEASSRARFARATALAARTTLRGKHIDLRQGEFARRRALGVVRRHARALSVGATVLLLAFGLNAYGEWTLLQARTDALETQLASESRALLGRRITDPARLKDAIEGKLGPDDPMPRFDAFDALSAISEAIPSEITHETRKLLTEIDDEAGRGRIELQGLVASVAERDTIASAIETHRCFDELEKGRTSPGPGGQGLLYRLEARVTCVYPPEMQRGKEKRRGKRRRRKKRGSR